MNEKLVCRNNCLCYKELMEPSQMDLDWIQFNFRNYDIDILEEINSGANAKVYKIKKNDSISAMRVLFYEVIKENPIILDDFLRTSEVVKDLFKEKNTGLEGIVKIDYAGLNKPRCNDKLIIPYQIMEYVEGKDLHERNEINYDLAYGEETSDEDAFITLHDNLIKLIPPFIKLCETFELIHSKRIYHGDVKPKNILFDEKKKTFKLCDWDMSSHFKKLIAGENSLIVGTPAYLAPELLYDVALAKCNYFNLTNNLGHFSDKRDVYSYGMTLFEAFEFYQGRYFEGGKMTVKSLYNSVFENELEYDFKLPFGIEEIISVMTKINPCERPNISLVKYSLLSASKKLGIPPNDFQNLTNKHNGMDCLMGDLKNIDSEVFSDLVIDGYNYLKEITSFLV